MSNYDKVLITRENYPTIFEAFELIAHDNGAQAGHQNYVMSLEWERLLKEIEKKLKNLREKADLDFECLCNGDDDERLRIVKDYHLEGPDKFLQDFFEEL